jgi:hypothetical protein
VDTDFGILLRLPDQDKEQLLDHGGRVQLVRRVSGKPIPRSRVRAVVAPLADPPHMITDLTVMDQRTEQDQ